MTKTIRGGASLLLLLALSLAGGVAACGDDDGGAEQSTKSGFASVEVPPLPSLPPATRVEAPRWSRADWEAKSPGGDLYANGKGVLVMTDGTEIRGWGDLRVRRYVTALFARMQHAFLTGDTAAVCKHVDPRSVISIGGGPGDDSCATKLSSDRRRLEDSGFRSSPLEFLWVREYPGVAGIWVEDVSGTRFRVPFARSGGGWQLELDELQPMEALAMPLRGY